uniref:Uncharacterized protein n=1 Tax=Anguilla anguilla TaxID=7936 RepID=A0A0E9VM07_ANGAN
MKTLCLHNEMRFSPIKHSNKPKCKIQLA